MTAKRNSARILELPTPQAANRPYAAELLELAEDGTLIVRDGAGRTQACDWLAHAAAPAVQLNPGDRLLVQPLGATERPVVMGCIGSYTAPLPATLAPHVAIESAESLSLTCGESSIELRADGKVLIRGDDVLVRAKGTQRIRAGSVSIN